MEAMPFDPHPQKAGSLITVHELNTVAVAAFRKSPPDWSTNTSRMLNVAAVRLLPHVAFPARCAVNICYDSIYAPRYSPPEFSRGIFEGMVELFDADLSAKAFDGGCMPAVAMSYTRSTGWADINKSLTSWAFKTQTRWCQYPGCWRVV